VESEHRFRISEVQHLHNSIKTSLQQGGNFLVSTVHPNGPIMREENLDYVHKASWGMYATGVDKRIIWKILDWVQKKALHPNGDFYFPTEEPEYRIMQRAYRPLTFLKVAAWIGHPLAKDKRVIERILQYQHKSGGVFHYIGEDPRNAEEQPTIGCLDTSFFGHLMVALNKKDHAIKAGDWVRRFVETNRPYMRERGLMYTLMTPDGAFVTDVTPEDKISKVVDNKDPKQQFWQPGTAMAYLCTLYDKLRSGWGCSEKKAKPYLDDAITLLEFEETMPIYTYFWPSKCKVGWGAGELLRVSVKYAMGEELMTRAYRIAEKVAVYTFIDNQLPDGSWSCLHYPLSGTIPEVHFNYKPLKGIVNVPESKIEGSKTIFLPAVELSGEILGEMKAIEVGVAAYLDHLRESERA